VHWKLRSNHQQLIAVCATFVYESLDPLVMYSIRRWHFVYLSKVLHQPVTTFEKSHALLLRTRFVFVPASKTGSQCKILPSCSYTSLSPPIDELLSTVFNLFLDFGVCQIIRRRLVNLVAKCRLLRGEVVVGEDSQVLFSVETEVVKRFITLAKRLHSVMYVCLLLQWGVCSEAAVRLTTPAGMCWGVGSATDAQQTADPPMQVFPALILAMAQLHIVKDLKCRITKTKSRVAVLLAIELGKLEVVWAATRGT